MAGVQDNVGEIVRDRFLAFLSRFAERVIEPGSSHAADSSQAEIETYVKQIEKMKELGLNVMMVDYSHVMSYDSPLAQAVAETFVRFEPFLKLALQQLIQQFHPDFLYEEHSTVPKDFYVAFYNMPSHIKCVIRGGGEGSGGGGGGGARTRRPAPPLPRSPPLPLSHQQQQQQQPRPTLPKTAGCASSKRAPSARWSPFAAR
jgi:hypothetical protein